MEEKIRKYVEYHFRNKKGKEKESLIEEVTNNLLERYEELKETYKDEDRAYRETIARMGDFTDVDREFNPVFTEIPKLYDVGLLIGVVLSVFGLVAIFLHSSLAFILTVISIVLFVGSAYYTYHKAQYEKTVNGDIDRFHLYLDKSFSYLKTAFIFWGITFSILFGQSIAGIFLFIEGVNNPMDAVTNIEDFIALYFISFLIASLLIGLVFYHIHKRIMNHYHYISGKNHLEGTFKKGLGMLQGEHTFFNKPFSHLVPWIVLGFYLLSLIVLVHVRFSQWNYSNSTEAPAFYIMFYLLGDRYDFVGVFPLLANIWMAVVIIVNIKRPSGKIRWFVLSALSVIGSYVLATFLAPENVRISFENALNPVTVLLALLIVILAWFVHQAVLNKPSKGQQ